MKPSLHAYIATVFFKGGGERDVHYDQLNMTRHGPLFCRVDESCEFFNAAAIDGFEIVKAAPLAVGGFA